jgi:hypothetical protein
MPTPLRKLRVTKCVDTPDLTRMPSSRKLPLGVACLVVTLVVSGCSWRGGSLVRPRGPQAPVVLQPGATAQQIVAAVNENTSRVHSYVSYNARFSVPGLSAIPLMQGNIALERPLKFRLQAGTAVTGSEIDLGSNPDLFWFWVRHNTPPALYFCRHDQYASSAAPQMLPVDPNWIGDALGLVELNPAATYEGPFPRSDGSLELRSAISTPSGPMTRVVVVDKERAWVLEQHLYDSASTPVASAIAENFVYDPVALVSLPRRVTMKVPQADMALTVDIGQLSVNVPTGDQAQLFTMPVMENYPRVDLGSTLPGTPLAATHVPLAPPTTAYDAPPSFPAATPAPVVNGTITPTVNRLPAGGVAVSP